MLVPKIRSTCIVKESMGTSESVCNQLLGSLMELGLCLKDHLQCHPVSVIVYQFAKILLRSTGVAFDN